MKIETFYLQNCGWDYMVLDEEDFNTRAPTGYWFLTESEAVADARACYPEVTEDEDPREYDQYDDPENGYNRPPTWPTPEPFDGPEFDDEVPF